ncbi:MAG: glucose-6-phosphate dehydrogenase [Ignavibacteriaceae bacterium]
MESKHVRVSEKGMLKQEPPAPCIVVIFGASGDLAHRELVPSLFSLYCIGLMPKNFAIIGFARRDYSDDKFRNEMHEALKKSDGCSEEKWQKFEKNLFYVAGDFKDEADTSYNNLKSEIENLQKEMNIEDNVLFHLSTPPSFYDIIIKRLASSGLSKTENGWRRVIIEKPFGHDEKSARELDASIQEVFNEEQIFRVDHFLGKETVQNMLVFRFANPGFEPIWNRNYIDNVQITVAETLGIETRGNFYEKTGVMRDMVQNHLLQLLCMTAIEPPVNYDSHSLRTETNQVLESVCKIDPINDAVLGQYDSGQVNGNKLISYRDENNVAEDSTVPTFAALRIKLDNWRWAGVPFYLRTGKRMSQKLTEITIRFKPTPHLMFPKNHDLDKKHNSLSFRLQPNEGIIYTFTAKQPGAELKLKHVNLNFEYATAFGIDEPPSAYQWLLFDAMKGDQTLFPRADWIYKAWSIIDPVVESWENKPWIKFPNYKSGSWGPDAANEMLKKDGWQWDVI